MDPGDQKNAGNDKPGKPRPRSRSPLDRNPSRGLFADMMFREIKRRLKSPSLPQLLVQGLGELADGRLTGATTCPYDPAKGLLSDLTEPVFESLSKNLRSAPFKSRLTASIGSCLGHLSQLLDSDEDNAASGRSGYHGEDKSGDFMMPGTRGMTLEDIGKLPVETVGLGASYRPCGFCGTDCKPGHQMMTLGCRHEFHMQCLHMWLNQNRTCPMCKKIVVF